MIDASHSPQTTWKRVATIVGLAVLILLALLLVWKKELHHHSSGSAHVNTPAASARPSSSMKKAPAATIPGGIPVSSRNPFQG
jgi:hypothetical protein